MSTAGQQRGPQRERILAGVKRSSAPRELASWPAMPDSKPMRRGVVVSGHSKWSTIKRQKGANDAKRGAIFTKLGNAIAIAARGGADPAANFSLRLAIDKAKAANMPSANIQRSVERGTGMAGGTQIQELVLEGYGPGGAGIIIECATDNINRTMPEVRTALTKHGGRMAEKGAVAYQFERKGMVRVKGVGEELALKAIDAGAEDIVEDPSTSSGKGESLIYTDPKQLAKVRDDLKTVGLEIIDAELTYVPKTTIEITDNETTGKIIRLMEALEEIDDVTATHTNFEIKTDE